MLKNNLKIKFGLGAIFRNPLRLIGALFTSIAAIGIAGLCAFTYSYSALEWEKDVFLNYLDDPYINIVVSNGTSIEYPSNITSIEDDFTLEKYGEIRDKVTELGGNYATMIWGQYMNPANITLSPYELNSYLGKNEEINDSELKETVYYEYNGEEIFAPYVSTSQDYESNSALYREFFKAMTMYSSEAALDDFGYTLVGKLPEEYNEVAIPQWLYNSFLCYGYRNPETGEVTVINSEEDIIGKGLKLVGDWKNNERRIVEATIVGVVHSDTENEKAFLDIDFNDGKYSQFSTDYSIPPQVGLVISQKFLSFYHTAKSGERYVNCVTVSRTTGLAEQYFEYVTEWKSDDVFMNVWTNTDSKITYAMAECIRMIYAGLPQVFNSTTIYFKIIPFIIPLAIGLLAYFVVSTVYGRKREMGILRSLGTSNIKIWLTYMLLFAFVAAVISCAALGVEMIFLNYMNNFLLWKANSINAGLPVRFYPFTITSETWVFTFLAPVLTVAASLAVSVFIILHRPIRALVAK